MSPEDKNRSRRALYQASKRSEASASRARAEAALLKDRLLKSEAECAELKAHTKAASERPGDQEMTRIFFENFRLREELEATKAALREAQRQKEADAEHHRELEILIRMDRDLVESELQQTKEELATNKAEMERLHSLRKFF